jgi:hypothetical protein
MCIVAPDIGALCPHGINRLTAFSLVHFRSLEGFKRNARERSVDLDGLLTEDG